MIRNWPGIATRFHAAPDGYIPLQLGSTTIGWISSSLGGESGQEPRMVKAVMGDKAYKFEFPALWVARESLGLTGDNDFEIQADFFADIILNVPVGSLDVTTHGHLIKYTDHTTMTLHSALIDFFRLRATHIQRELHKLTPTQAMETLLSLMTNHYPWDSLAELSWRGTKLKSLPSASRMMYQNQKIGWDSSVSTILPVKITSSFMGFLKRQTFNIREEKTFKQKLLSFKPENVFFLKAESEEEQLLGETLFDKHYLNVFLEETNHQADPKSDKTFFFAQADDSLADWIVGTTITVSDLHRMVVAKGLL